MVRLSERHPSALLTVEDLVATYNIAQSASDLQVDDDSDWIQWTEHEIDDNDSIAPIAS